MTDTNHRFTLAIIAAALAGFALGSLLFKTVPSANKDALLIALGFVLALSKDSYAFYFGASKGGVDLAERNAGIVEASATASNVLAAAPLPVEVVNTPDSAVPVEAQR